MTRSLENFVDQLYQHHVAGELVAISSAPQPDFGEFPSRRCGHDRHPSHGSLELAGDFSSNRQEKNSPEIAPGSRTPIFRLETRPLFALRGPVPFSRTLFAIDRPSHTLTDHSTTWPSDRSASEFACGCGAKAPRSNGLTNNHQQPPIFCSQLTDHVFRESTSAADYTMNP